MSFRRPLFLLSGLALLAGSVVARAEDATSKTSIGAESDAWLELQKSGAAASTVERPLPGELADRSYDRYAETFTHPIPDSLVRDSFISDGGGGGK